MIIACFALLIAVEVPFTLTESTQQQRGILDMNNLLRK